MLRISSTLTLCKPLLKFDYLSNHRKAASLSLKPSPQRSGFIPSPPFFLECRAQLIVVKITGEKAKTAYGAGWHHAKKVRMCPVPWLSLCHSILNTEGDLYNFQHN